MEPKPQFQVPKILCSITGQLVEIKIINMQIVWFPLRLFVQKFGCQQSLATPSNQDPIEKQSW